MSVSELQKDSVERTLCIPLWCRAIAVKKLPQILPDYDAVRYNPITRLYIRSKRDKLYVAHVEFK